MNHFHVPVGYSAIALSSTKINGAEIWNDLSLGIKKNDDAIYFTICVKNHFLGSYISFLVRYVIVLDMLL